MIGRSIAMGLALALAAPVIAAPAGDISPMHLPNGGGYLQPGNPNRGISSVSADSPLAKQVRKRCDAAKDKACAAKVKTPHRARPAPGR